MISGDLEHLSSNVENDGPSIVPMNDEQSTSDDTQVKIDKRRGCDRRNQLQISSKQRSLLKWKVEEKSLM